MEKPAAAPQSGILGLIERLGNLLPDPIFLFALFAIGIAVLSAIGSAAGWSVQPVKPQVVMVDQTQPDGTVTRAPKLNDKGRPEMQLVNAGDPIKPRSLLSADGIYWAIANCIRNFLNFPPLGVVLVGMLGIGVAEKVGLFGAAMKWTASLVPSKLLTPTVVFLGVMSNVASDAGYIVLPPLAAGLYIAYGRSPIAGICAAFAGISGGFSANLLLSPTDALMSELTGNAAKVLDPHYTVQPTCNWYFMAASTPFVILLGWIVTSRTVERRFNTRPADQGGPSPVDPTDTSRLLTQPEKRGLLFALLATLVAGGIAAALLLIPGAPLHGDMPARAPQYGLVSVDPASWGNSKPQPRWSQGVVPIIVMMFLLPGVAYGVVTKSITKPADLARAFVDAMRSMAPIIAVAFFAAQFLEYLKFSRLDSMVAYVGGKALVDAGLHSSALVIGVVFLTLTINILISSMSAKWTILSPILVPMLMMVGISPEVSQLAYRVGDSVTNIVTPMNAYMLIVLTVCQKYWKNAGIGNLIALMLPYSVIFTIGWAIFLLIWLALGISPGQGASLHYSPAH